MKDSWICRDYQGGDEYQILTLYKEVNEREMTLAHWMWKFTQNPFGPAVIKLMFDDNRLIGHYAVLPMNVQVQKTLVKAALSVNTMTHPDYRGHGIFAYLGEEAYRACEQKGVKFVYGFPNSNIYQPRIKKLDWKGFGKMTILQKDLQRGAESTSRLKNINKVDIFDSRVNSLWNKVNDGYRVIVARTKGFLNWRFTENPVVKYSRFVFQVDSNEVLGYMVLKTYAGEDEIKGHIVDMLCINEKNIVKDFLRYSCNYFVESGIRNLSCWAPESSFYAQVLEEEGFARKEFDVYFGVRIFDKEDKALGSLEQIANWHLTMCDSDVF